MSTKPLHVPRWLLGMAEYHADDFKWPSWYLKGGEEIFSLQNQESKKRRWPMWPWNLANELHEIRSACEMANETADRALCLAREESDALREQISILKAQYWWDKDARGYDGHWITTSSHLLFHGRRFVRNLENWFSSPSEADILNKQYGYMSLEEWLEEFDD